MAAKEWSFRRKLLGNLLPMLGGAPFGAIGLWLAIQRQEMGGLPLAVFALMPVVGWLLMNLIGLWQNGSMRRALANKLDVRGSVGKDCYFVGLARPAYRGLLDPHEDVGFLILAESSLEFRGEALRFKLDRKDLFGARFRPNIHTLVGLGRWISVEGKMEGTPIRLLVEPRDRPTLLGNLWLSKRLKRRIEEWLAARG